MADEFGGTAEAEFPADVEAVGFDGFGAEAETNGYFLIGAAHAEEAHDFEFPVAQTGEGIRGEVKWNFTKFLVDPKGRVVGRFEPGVEPEDPKLRAAIEAALPTG